MRLEKFFDSHGEAVYINPDRVDCALPTAPDSTFVYCGGSDQHLQIQSPIEEVVYRLTTGVNP